MTTATRDINPEATAALEEYREAVAQLKLAENRLANAAIRHPSPKVRRILTKCLGPLLHSLILRFEFPE